MGEEAPACRICGSTDARKLGRGLDTKNRLLSQRYKCKKCGSTFTAGKMVHMQIPDYVVRLCIGLARNGMYLKEIAPLVTEATGVHVNNSSVGRWLKKYEPGYKPRLGRKPDPTNRGKKYYSPKTTKSNLATIRALRADMARMEAKLKVLERRVRTGRGK